MLLFPLLGEHLYTFAKHLPPLLEAQTTSFIGTVHSDVERDEVSDPEADHMCDLLLVKTTIAIINPNTKNNNSEYRFLVNHYSDYNTKNCFINQTQCKDSVTFQDICPS